MKKHLSTIANDLLQRCAEILETSEDALVEQFETNLKTSADNYSRNLVEFFSSKAVEKLCSDIGEKISDASFSRLTFNMMLAWEVPNSWEIMGKEREDRNDALKGNPGQMHDDIPLFYSDIMPFLVDEEHHVGEDAFVWLGSVLPLVADVVSARFEFEKLTASTANRLHYPAYDRFLKEIDRCRKYLQKQSTPTGSKFAEDEFILHVEGTGMTQRVVRHIGLTSWPGRLTLTNRALYFEASMSVSYENAVKIDLSNAVVEHEVKPASTGPFGAPLFDNAIAYESSQLTEPVLLEFPEMASSTRRDHWLALIKEVMLMHRFLSEFKAKSFTEETSLQAWEVEARTILGVMRLHAAREMLRIAPPQPISFLIFALYDELPKGDYVLEELCNSLKKAAVISELSASSILVGLNFGHKVVGTMNEEGVVKTRSQAAEALASLETTIEQVREEAKMTGIAKETVEKIKDEGISESILVLLELLSPLQNFLCFFRRIISWERPELSFSAFVITLVVIYKEWFGPVLAALLTLVVGTMLWLRRKGIGELPEQFVVSPPSDKTAVESIVAAQHGIKSFDTMVKQMNVTILKLKSIFVSKAPKHANIAMWGLSAVAFLLMIVPFKFFLIGLATYTFMSNLRTTRNSKGEQGSRRLKEWWETIPVIPVRIVSSSP